MGLFSKSKAPKPPDPAKTAAAQTQTNLATAIAENQMNQVNQVGPDGSLTYTQSGTYTYRDPLTGKSYQLPKTTATTTLSEAQQKIKNEGDAAEFNLAKLANSQSSFLNDYMAKPFDGSNDATEARIMELGGKRLTPELDRSRASLETRLANQGIKIGSAAYDRAMEGQGQKENDAWNQLLLQGHGQAFAEGQAIRNQPINEITALLSGSQVSQPNFVNTPQSSVANTDYAGLVNANYQQKLAAQQSEQAAKDAMLGGLFKLGSSAIMYSDRRLKTDIKKVGKTDDDQNIYSYRYKGGKTLHLGLMAQEVQKKKPEAVLTDPSGFKMVDYDIALGA